MKKILFIILSILLIWCVRCDATEYFVRADGGDNTECDGSTNVAWDTVDDDIVTNCAFEHPNWVLAINPNPSLMASGDIMTIHCGDDFKMGWNTPNISNHSQCPTTPATTQGRNCHNNTIPEGIDANNHTIIRGDCYATGCANPPELWATEQLTRIFTIGSGNVTLECLEMTDHDDCTKLTAHTNDCDRTYPSGDWGERAIYNWGATTQELKLINLNIHGFATYGIKAGGFSGGLIVDSVYLDGNGSGGWNFDLDGGLPSNDGDLTFDNVHVRYNGCQEVYPPLRTTNDIGDLYDDIILASCAGQDITDNGDGFGTPSTGGQWTFRDSSFIANSADGLDLLYVSGGGSSTVLRSKFYNNNGNQLKTSGAVYVEDSFIGGTCDYIENEGLKHPAIAGPYYFQVCRAGGSASTARLRSPGQTFTYVNNTFLGRGSADIQRISNKDGITCNGSEFVKFRNNVFLSGEVFNDSSSETGLFGYTDTSLGGCFGYLTIDWGTDGTNISYNANTGDDPCGKSYSAGFGCPQSDPKFNGVTISGLDADFVCTDVHTCDVSLQVTSPAIGIGTTAIAGRDSLDITGADRGAVYDSGAYEYETTAADCDSDCSLCANQGTCEASTAYDCGGTGFCCWNTSVCETTVADVCDADHCGLCLTQSPCEAVSGSACTWDGSTCEVSQPAGTGSTFTGGCVMKTGTFK